MNKKELFKLELLVVAIILSFIALISSTEIILGVFAAFTITIAVTIFLIYKYKDTESKKLKTLMIVLSIISGIMILYILYILLGTHAYQIIHDYYGNEIKIINYAERIKEIVTFLSLFIYFISMFLSLLLCFDDLDKKTNKVNYILTVIVTILAIIVSINFLVNPYINSLPDKVHCLLQNYPYFSIMYIGIIIHRFINKVS